jgi:hypothetical protein
MICLHKFHCSALQEAKAIRDGCLEATWHLYNNINSRCGMSVLAKFPKVAYNAVMEASST